MYFIYLRLLIINRYRHEYEQDQVEGYLELSAKTKTYFATAVNMWDAEFYIKVDDDVHVNIGNFGLHLVKVHTFDFKRSNN